jgi:FkbM family methyltransferase
MMIKRLAKRILFLTPYTIHRGPPNRFQAIELALGQLSKSGYVPRVIIDSGAHLGDFTNSVRRLFPNAHIHMIEPQPACRVELEKIAAALGFSFHPYALGSVESSLRMWAGQTPSTGANIAAGAASTEGTITVPATTLDRLFSSSLCKADRALLKLDLQGFELEAMKGGTSVLPAVEVILTEVSFFAQSYEPPIHVMVEFLNEHGFDLFDVVSLSGRKRDNRLRQGDFLFVRRGSSLLADTRWA